MTRQFVCLRCGHSWWPRRFGANGVSLHPGNCPRCKSPYWNRPRIHRKPKEETLLNGAVDAKPPLVIHVAD